MGPRDLRRHQSKSRTSTPLTTTPFDANSPPSHVAKEKSKTFLDRWVEPSVKNPAPSFEEHGFARYGVLENMQALGTPPSAKVRQRVRSAVDPTALRTTLGKNGNLLAGEEGASTPEMTPAPELERDDSGIHEEEELPVALQVLDEDEDDDWVPSKSKSNAKNAKTSVRGTPTQNQTPLQNKSPLKNGIVRAASSTQSPAIQNAAPPLEDAALIARKQRMLIAVNDAVQRSNAHQNPIIGTVLRQLHDESRANPHYHGVLEAVLNQSPTEEQKESFRRYIKDAKKTIKRESKGTRAREKRAVGHSRKLSESSPFLSGSPIAAKTPNAVSPSKVGAFTGISEQSSRAARRRSRSGDLPMEYASPNPAVIDLSHFTPNPLTTAPTLSAKPSPSPHASRMPSKSPRKPKTKEHAVQDRRTGLDVEAPSKAPSPTARTPDSVLGASHDDDSDLSDVNEEIVQNGPPEPVVANGNENVAAPAVQKLKLQAARGGKKPSRANSAKPNGRWEKKPLPTTEDLAEEQELARRRQEMVELQPSRLIINPPMSDIRYDDDLLETESLTESMIAVGPPGDLNRPRRAGRGSRPGLTVHGKRLREDNSAFPSSPLESAGTTRPSTPAVTAPAAKRIKLTNGNAARTKRSPVKNRDGPIAGIAHTGGGSRQLGPDDNDPDSPPSESDDFCSACRGAGEFVCCDGCTRVFHYLCCDPPREDAPDGSFLCFECEARLKPADELAAESFMTLGPLFKQLNNINPRSFALPADIQNYFENVSVRNDGSYGEEVKKFALSKSSGYGYQKPDYLKTHDAEHNLILCCQCGKSTAGKRAMLKCDYCQAYWHLDCCDPPLANPPPINLESSTRDAWKCPRHVDHDLRSGQLYQHDLNAVADGDVNMTDAEPTLRVKRKVRRPKQLTTVEPTFSRGLRNNGMVDIMNDPDDDTDGEGNYVFSPDESKDLNFKVFRVPEKGIITDFISKVKLNRIEQKRQDRKTARHEARRLTAQQQFAVRPLEEQRAALHLAQLADKQNDIGLNGFSVDALYLRLTAEAPDEVVSALSDERRSSGPEPMTDAKRAELVKLRELIDRALAG